MRCALFAFVLSVSACVAEAAAAGSKGLERLTFASPDGTATGTALVAVPRNAAAPGHAGRRQLGTLILLHGFNGSPREFASNADLSALAEEHHLVIASPTLGNTWYVDGPLGSASRSALAHAQAGREAAIALGLVPQLAARFGSATTAMIAGMSMGGYGALRLGLRHPGTFTVAVGLAPCLRPSTWGRRWELDAAMGLAEERAPYDLFTAGDLAWLNGGPVQVAGFSAGAHRTGPALDALPVAAGRPRLGLICGDGDFFFPDVELLHRALDGARIAHHYEVLPGHVHDMAFVKAAIPRLIAFLMKP